MTPTTGALLLAAGVGAGVTGSVAGLASVVSYPVMLALGYSPLAANVTNTVALLGSGFSGALNSRRELAGQGRRLKRMVLIGVVGGGLGAALLLLTPADTFEFVVPWLIGSASLVILLRPRAPRVPIGPPPTGALAPGPAPSEGLSVAIGVFCIAIYGGYFGAAAGVMLLALLLARTTESLPRSNAAKIVILTAANAVAAVPLMFFGPVAWAAAVPLCTGCVLGGAVGPIIVRRSPDRPLRMLIGGAGLALAITLAVQTY